MTRKFKTEDQVRDEMKITLGFDDGELDVVQGTGQLTTFKQLGFTGKDNNKKPDGWYLPDLPRDTAIILEAKNSDEDVNTKKWVNETLRNCKIASSKYKNVIGILYNGYEHNLWVNGTPSSAPSDLQHKEFYLRIITSQKVDKELIYTLTSRINNNLHFNFGVKNLYHRMIFTACALVAIRYGANLQKGAPFAALHSTILSTLNKSLAKDMRQNIKLGIVTEVYADIKMNTSENQEAIDSFIEDVNEISAQVNSDNWRGEDVMGIFFNEFNRYKGKSENGQVFTPEHITSLMYRLIEVDKDDYLLDAACGSGGFLVKAMSNMIQEVGGVNAKDAPKIKSDHLFGIEFDREIYALAAANMMIHKDGKTNLEQLDSRTPTAATWMQQKPITKVLMNPPFEKKYGCIDIVLNVLGSVKKGTKCAFILPDKKLEKESKTKVKRLLKENRIETIVKLSEKTFFEGVTTSVFIITAGIPQDGHNIIGYYIEEDGLETVKNKGRQDVKDRWPSIEEYWVKAIRDGNDSKYSTRQIIDPKEHLSYQMPTPPFEIYEEDFIKTAMDYLMFEESIDRKEFGDKVLESVLYSDIEETENEKHTSE